MLTAHPNTAAANLSFTTIPESVKFCLPLTLLFSPPQSSPMFFCLLFLPHCNFPHTNCVLLKSNLHSVASRHHWQNYFVPQGALKNQASIFKGAREQPYFSVTLKQTNTSLFYAFKGTLTLSGALASTSLLLGNKDNKQKRPPGRIFYPQCQNTEHWDQSIRESKNLVWLHGTRYISIGVEDRFYYYRSQIQNLLTSPSTLENNLLQTLTQVKGVIQRRLQFQFEESPGSLRRCESWVKEKYATVGGTSQGDLTFLVSWKNKNHLVLLSHSQQRHTHLCIQKGFIHQRFAGKHCLYESLQKKQGLSFSKGA